MAPLPDFHTPVRGHAFAARPPGAAAPGHGESLELVREPCNPADPQAVALWAGSGGTRWRIGYLDRAVAARVAPRLDAGVVVHAEVAGWTPAPGGAWRRPLVHLTVADGPSGPRRDRTAAPAREAPDLPSDGLFGRPPGSTRRTLPRTRGGRAAPG